MLNMALVATLGLIAGPTRALPANFAGCRLGNMKALRKKNRAAGAAAVKKFVVVPATARGIRRSLGITPHDIRAAKTVLAHLDINIK
jgi:hypothetical protein